METSPALTESGNLVASLLEETVTMRWIVPLGESMRHWGLFARMPVPEMSQEDQEIYDSRLLLDED